MAERTYVWYVYPRDAHTNQALSLNSGFEFAGEMTCKDNTKRQLWCGNSLSIDALCQSKQSLGLDFLLFVQEGRGTIRPANFRLKIRRKKKAFVRTLAERR